ncbi:hypothetical protein CHARACLAT_015591 [Characodon lateralis]|uniref:Uncharacterized protein n=1 Tax=Characodon lateralis TaxID=208331 RepID=A0ABU7CP91_9TELE|nr:hypothetical protein [Characodon lateralis]
MFGGKIRRETLEQATLQISSFSDMTITKTSVDNKSEYLIKISLNLGKNLFLFFLRRMDHKHDIFTLRSCIGTSLTSWSFPGFSNQSGSKLLLHQTTQMGSFISFL